MSVTVKRPVGRNELRGFMLFGNHRGVPEFCDHSTTWNDDEWRLALRPNDIIQLVPKAYYPGWINFVRRASIKIAYEPVDAEKEAGQPLQSFNSEFYVGRLEPEGKEIRVLELRPGGGEEEIRCEMRLTRLGSGQVYNALSYCWGDVTDSSEIDMDATSIGGLRGPFTVSQSVKNFLRRIRHEQRTLTIWIDQICINQSDTNERAQQVTLMAEIYSRANLVHIWLGEGNSGSHEALRILRDIYNFNERSCPGGDECKCEETPHSLPTSLIDGVISQRDTPPSYKAMYEIFHEHIVRFFTDELRHHAGGPNNEQLTRLTSYIFGNPWFRRVWVLQEALLARNATVHCGKEKVPWNEVLTVGTWLRSSAFANQEPHIEPFPSVPMIWSHLRTPAAPPSSSSTLAPSSEHHPAQPHRRLPILDVFLSSLDLKATDPRDKLFSLYSFSSDAQMDSPACAPLLPSYTKSASRVFTAFTRWWIRENRSLAILSTLHGLPGRSWVRTHDVGGARRGDAAGEGRHPSWALDSVGTTKSAGATIDVLFGEVRATGDSVPDVGLLDVDGKEEEDGGEVLWLSGYKVTEVEEMTYLSLETEMEDLHDEGKELLRVFEKLFDPCNRRSFWKSKGLSERTGDASVEGDEGGFGDHLRAHWGYGGLRGELVSAGEAESLGDGEGLVRQDTYKVPACLDPFLMVGTDGRCGLCPWMAKVGDVVVVLARRLRVLCSRSLCTCETGLA